MIDELMFDKALGWIYDHVADDYDYAVALKHIGFTKEMALEEFRNNLDFDEEEYMEILDNLYKED